MNVHDGRIGLTRDDLDAMRVRGFDVAEHTPYYMTGVTASYGDTTVGLYNWLDGLDAYIGDTQVLIRTEEQAQRFLAVMNSLIDLRQAMAASLPTETG